MKPHAVWRDIHQRLVDGVDVERDRVEEAVEGFVLEEAGAFHGEVRAVELEHEPAAHDQLVFLAHLAGERPHVALVGAVVGVEHDGGDDARGGRRHEWLGEPVPLGARAAVEHLALGRGLAEVRVRDLGHGLGRVVDAGGARSRAGEARHVVRVLGDVARHAPLALAAEPLHPLGRVGREADAGLLAVVADVDARLELLLHHVADGGLGLPGEGDRVDGLATVEAHEEVSERGRTRQAAGVGRQDALLATLDTAS